jgi:predicted  nucleic acid-binding Zn-ribbon protein
MADFTPAPMNQKSFWQRPEGVTGTIFMAGIVLSAGYLFYKLLPTLITLAENTLYLGLIVAAIGALLFVVLDPKARNLIWYMYKSIMRWITGLFVEIDPIGILKSYVEDLEDNLQKMNKQIGMLRGQMHKLKEIIVSNQKQIDNNLSMANRAKESNNQAIMVLKARSAGRLKESNLRLDELYKKMEILYRVLGKMYENSEILKEDIKDQVVVKEQERKAIHASHSAMRSAMNIISGNNDKRMMFDMAMESIADDVASKVGEMERFMEMSGNFMNSIDLQNGVFEEEGMKMLEQWEKEGTSLLLGKDKELLIAQANDDRNILNLDAPSSSKQQGNRTNQYDSLFD